MMSVIGAPQAEMDKAFSILALMADPAAAKAKLDEFAKAQTLLDEREKALDEREGKIETALADAAAAKKAADTVAAVAAQREQEAAATVTANIKVADAASQLQRDLAVKIAAADSATGALNAREAALSGREAVVRAKEADLAEMEDNLATREAAVAASRKRLVEALGT